MARGQLGELEAGGGEPGARAVELGPLRRASALRPTSAVSSVMAAASEPMTSRDRVAVSRRVVEVGSAQGLAHPRAGRPERGVGPLEGALGDREGAHGPHDRLGLSRALDLARAAP